MAIQRREPNPLHPISIRQNSDYRTSQLSPPSVCISMPKLHQRLAYYDQRATMPGIFGTDAAAAYVHTGVNRRPVSTEWPRK